MTSNLSPPRPEDVREELIRIMEEKLYALKSGKLIFGLNAAADAILAKYKMEKYK